MSLPAGRAEVLIFVAAAPMPSASAHSLGALRLLEACTAVSYCSQVAASWPALARKRGSWEVTITVRDSARNVVECVMDLFSVRHIRLTKLRATKQVRVYT